MTKEVVYSEDVRNGRISIFVDYDIETGEQKNPCIIFSQLDKNGVTTCIIDITAVFETCDFSDALIEKIERIDWRSLASD